MNSLRNIIAIVIVFFALGTLSAQDNVEYYFSKTVKGSFSEVTQKTKAALKEQGFGVITEIDMDQKLKEKLDDVEMLPYKILGVCSPAYAYQTIQVEENIGLFLPCKVLVKDLGNGNIEVVMVDPQAIMGFLKKEELNKVAAEVSLKFQLALKNI